MGLGRERKGGRRGEEAQSVDADIRRDLNLGRRAEREACPPAGWSAGLGCCAKDKQACNRVIEVRLGGNLGDRGWRKCRQGREGRGWVLGGVGKGGVRARSRMAGPGRRRWRERERKGRKQYYMRPMTSRVAVGLRVKLGGRQRSDWRGSW